MITTIKNWVRHYPEQAFLVLFNTGVFAWLSTTGSAITSRLNWDNLTVLPAWLLDFANNSLEKIQGLFGHSAWTWLIISMLLTLFLRFIRGVIKLILFLLILGIGLYLIYRHQSVLGQLPS
ncbi:hypothetical protein ACVR0S_04080 [Streptococcus dentapri]|uniref:Uncharacterized protein n=1 Tax=Streptococcus dentapri TaxID=573564 RepID=A0ABV8D3S6_9STRE